MAKRTTGFNSDNVFNEFYLPMLERFRKGTYWHDFTMAVRRSVAAFTYQFRDEDLWAVHRETLSKTGSSLEKVNSAAGASEEICLWCLSYAPFYTLSCGHRVCDRCVKCYCSGNGFLVRCLLCGEANYKSLRSKPPTAGVRVLKLSGTIAEAQAMCCFLRTLRSKLRVPLHECFDLVIADGVGVFFAIMIFCKQASVEECEYHLGNLRCVKVQAKGFRFGHRLCFGLNELDNNLAQVLLGAHVPQNESERLWPSCKVDTALEFHGGVAETERLPAAEILLASLFYIEVEDLPVFIPKDGVIIRLHVKCRLPPGPVLANAMMRMRMMNARVWYGENTEDQLELCASVTWDRIRAGQSFQKLLLVRVESRRALINVMVSSSAVSKSCRASNCPFVLEDLAAIQHRATSAIGAGRTIRRPGKSTMEVLEETQNQLRKLV